MNINLSSFLISIVVFGSLLEVYHGGELRKHFYKDSCPLAEDIVKEIIWKRVASNSNLPAKFLRMHFHDCFVNFQRPIWKVLIGRRDGSISRISDALNNIPSPSFNFNSLKQSFANKSLTVHDLVVLSGGHTIGVGHCKFFSQRLYNFAGKNDADPSLNSTYATFLKTQCKSLSNNITIMPMDPGSPLSFDNNYFKNLKLDQGLFQFDAALLTNNEATNTVEKLLDSQDFFTEFGQSMKRMGAIHVLTGSSGEIRKKCNVVNS